MQATAFGAIAIDPAEWHVLCGILDVTLRAPGNASRPSRAASSAARDRMHDRGILGADGTRVSADVASLLFTLARPAASLWAHRHGEAFHTAQFSFQRRMAACAWDQEGTIWLAPTSGRTAAGDLAGVLGWDNHTHPHVDERFSIAGGLWRDLTEQAAVASERALSSLATAEGVDSQRVSRVVELSRASTARVDVRFTRPRGGRTWTGSEVSLLPVDGGLWSVSDGRSFHDLHGTGTGRATFARCDLRELIAGFVAS